MLYFDMRTFEQYKYYVFVNGTCYTYTLLLTHIITYSHYTVHECTVHQNGL